jgi:hypothetical protein
MAIRDYNFIVGPETSNLPTASSPSTDDDFMSKGYADDTYAFRQYFGDAVATNAALKAIGSADRFDGQLRLITGTNKAYRFDSSSTAVDDGDTVLQPDSGTGRWVIISSSGSASSAQASALNIAELLSGIQKNGSSVGLSDASVVAEGFYSPGELQVISLGRDYTSGTSIYLDPDKLSLQAADATSGWTQFGAQAGSPTLDTTNFVEGTGSVQTSVSATTVENGLYYDFNVFSLSSRKLRISVRLNTLTNISAIRVRLWNETGETNGKYWDLTTQANGDALVADFNEIEVDPLVTATGSSGSFNVDSVLRVKVSVTPSSSQAFNLNVDNVRHVDNREVPFYVTYNIHGSTLETMNVASGSKGKYVISSGLSNAYSISSGAVRRCLGQHNAGNSSWEFLSTATGTAAKTNRYIVRKNLDESKSGTLKWSLEWKTESSDLKISTVTDTTHFKVSSATDRSAEFLSGSVIWAYRKVWDGNKYVFPDEPIRLTLSANATYSSSEITFTHTEDNTGITTTDWYVVFEAAKCRTYVGDVAATETLTLRTPELLVPNGFSRQSLVLDNFTRGDASGIGGSWTLTTHVNDNSQGSNAIASNIWTVSQADDGSRRVYALSAYQNSIFKPVSRYRFKFKTEVTGGLGGGGTSLFSVGAVIRNTSASDGAASAGNAIFACLRNEYDNTSATSSQLHVINGGVTTTTTFAAQSISAIAYNTYAWVDIWVNGDILKMRAYAVGSSVPAWQLSANLSGLSTGKYWQLGVRSDREQDESVKTSIDDFEYYTDSGSFVTTGTVTSQSGQCISIAADLLRDDSTNVNPSILAISAALV